MFFSSITSLSIEVIVLSSDEDNTPNKFFSKSFIDSSGCRKKSPIIFTSSITSSNSTVILINFPPSTFWTALPRIFIAFYFFLIFSSLLFLEFLPYSLFYLFFLLWEYTVVPANYVSGFPLSILDNQL